MTPTEHNKPPSLNIEDAGTEDDSLQLTKVYRNNIAAHTKRLRERAGIRQKDLAKIMNTGQGHIASLETARISIGLHTLTRLAHAFNVEPASMLVPLQDDDPASKTSDEQAFGAAPAPTKVHVDDMAATQEKIIKVPFESAPSSLGVGVNLSTVKEMVAAALGRLEALERRHGSVPMTREMLTSVLVALLNASQNMDGDGNAAG